MAGLFALFYGMFSFTSNIISTAKSDSYCIENKQRAIENGNKTYLDLQGWEHFVDNDELCITTWDERNGHRIIKSINKKGLPTGLIFYDYDKEKEEQKQRKFEEKIQEAINLGHSYVNCEFRTDECTLFTGYEIETKRRYYVKHNINGCYFLHYVVDEPLLKQDVGGNYHYYYPCINKEIKVITKEEYEERVWWLYNKKE